MFRYKKSALFMLAGSFIFALLGGGRLPYFVFYALSLSVVFSYSWTRMIINRLNFSQRTMSDYAYVGDEVEVRTMIFNESFLPAACIEISDEMVKRISGKPALCNVVSLAPLDSRCVVEKFKCKYRGYYMFGPVDVNISDILGLFTWRREIKCAGSLPVYPRVAALKNFNIRPMQMFGTVSTKQNANEDYSSISDIRNYYPGDSFKKIHWKVSAKKGSLYVKNFEMSGSAESYIFLNLSQYDYNDIYRNDIEEKAVECAASIVYYMLGKNINTGMYSNGKNISYIRGRDIKEFKKFMEELITVKSNGLIPMEELLESRSRLMPRGSSIILITPSLNERLVDKIVQMSESEFDVTIIYIMVEELKKEYKDVLEHYKIKLYSVGIRDDVKASLEG
jgi:uncharacterized protein (DUF58 family)